MKKYGLHGKLTAKEGKADELADILIQASELASSAKGCRLYLVSTDKDDTNSVWVTEVWDTKEDHDNSLEDPKVKKLISQALPLLDGQPEKGQTLEVLGGAGL